MRSVTHFSNFDKKLVFFSTSHLQSTAPEGFVPVTSHLPLTVAKREEFPDGMVHTREELVELHYSDYEIIPNPDPKYQA